MGRKNFTEIPMRTWNWLGVNEVQTDVEAEVETFSIAANETRKLNQINLSKDKAAKKLHIKVEANAQVELTVVDLSENDSASSRFTFSSFTPLNRIGFNAVSTG